MPAQTYSLYGFKIQSPWPLPAETIHTDNPDWRVVAGPARPVPVRRPRGRLLAEFHYNDTVGYAHTALKNTYVLRFFGACEFHCERAARTIEVRPDPRAPEGLCMILLTGSVLACLLSLAGTTVLHASAVAVNGGAIAFAGHSGCGKSTMAAMACAAGARLFTDDVLPLQAEATGLSCSRGSTEIRLRPAAAELAEAITPQGGTTTPDGRLAVCPKRESASRLPLRALILPRPDRGAQAAELQRLDKRAALVALLGIPRILGWRDHQIPAADLQDLAHLAAQVPMFEATVPWGPPFNPAHAAHILKAATQLD